jgi:uncharacterized protein YbaP (TraB family)
MGRGVTVRRRLGAVAVLVLAWCVASAAAQVGTRNFLWKVEGPGNRSAYLLGSLHVLTADYYPLSAVINQAFAGSRTLVEELDLDETRNPVQMRSALGRALLTDGRLLRQLVSPATYAELSTRAAAAGLPMEAVGRMKPWFAAVTLMMPTFKAAGLSGEFGVDAHFFDRAKKAGMRRQALETLDYQLDRFDELSPALQEEMLRSTMAELDTYVGKLHDLARAWAVGDTNALARELLASFAQSRELYDRLVVERNRNWIAHVDTCLREDAGCFIVVGAAHLVGPDGLPTLLANKGYRVTQQ